ncbi:MAG: hypothetical protein JSV32_03490 [Dehalococcoidia bacterium]|nr:MAG: hypothetical protein JSV32_03490 [Dehalococcoidia bacterium]
MSTASKLTALIISCVILVLLLFSCYDTEVRSEKMSSELLAQVNLRKEQIAHPTSDRLELMKSMGMMVDNLEIQRIFIHLSQKLNASQIEELEAMRITLYLDSWIPPVGNHPTGFLLADVPIDKIEELAEKEYVVRLDTAERQLEPQAGSQPQAE